MGISVQMSTTAPADEVERLVQAAQRDPAAFSALYDRFVRPVYRYHYSRTGSAADAQDLTAHTFLAALEALPRYHPQGLFAAWLFRIARNKAHDFFRQDRPWVDLEQAEGRIVPADLLGQVAEGEQLARLRVLVSNLPEAERELLRLRYVVDLTYAEMAAIVGKSEQAVKKTVYRVLARLQSQLEA